LSQYTRVTDRRTDGRTDRILIAIPRLHYMQRGKNLTTFDDRLVMSVTAMQYAYDVYARI